jgi:hypothetical protein
MAAALQPPIDAPHRPAPRPRPVRLLLVGLLLGGAGALLGMQLGKWLKLAAPAGRSGLALNAWETVGLAVACLIALHLILLAHELGHLLGGRLVGFRAFLLIVGPVRVERSGDRWRLHRNRSAALWGGLAGSAATDARDLRRRTTVMVAGGPLVSLLGGVAALVGYWALHPALLNANSPYGRVVLAFVLLSAGVASISIGVATLIPMRTSGFLSDGARLLRLARGGAVAARDAAVQAVIGQSLAGVRPRDWPAEMLQTALALPDGSAFEFTVWQLAQSHAADTGHAAEAQRWLQLLLTHIDRIPPTFRSGLQLDAARQLALAGDTTKAKSLVAAATGPVIGAGWAAPLAHAAVLSSEGCHADAVALLPEIRAALAGSIDRGGALALLDSVALIESRAQRASARD